MDPIQNPKEYFQNQKNIFEKSLAVINQMGPLDDDGYPTEDCLNVIANWHDSEKYNESAGLIAWMDFIVSIWSLTEPSKKDVIDPVLECPCVEYTMSTGGWSGNEQIIAAMKQNLIYWSFSWFKSQRGGHYTFLVKK